MYEAEEKPVNSLYPCLGLPSGGRPSTFSSSLSQRRPEGQSPAATHRLDHGEDPRPRQAVRIQTGTFV